MSDTAFHGRFALAMQMALAAMTSAAAAPVPAAGSATRLDPVRVTATGVEGVAPFELPASIDTVTLDSARARPDVNLSEVLAGVPGLAARDRQNYAQDTQLSIRGFGARSTFGVRGVRLYADGIPASMPDGQGQLSHFNLAAGERVEILRGPFSSLYGNSSGGVVQLWSALEAGAPGWRAQVSDARYDSAARSVRVLGGSDGLQYNVAASHFETQGFRAHSAARRESGNAVLRWRYRDDGVLDLVFNHFDTPRAQDPLGLTRAQFAEDPRQVAGVARSFDTRKTVRQDQAGALLRQDFGAGHSLRLLAYAGERDVLQYLAVPVAAQGNALSSGGVVDLSGDYSGLDARWTWQGTLRGGASEVALGFDLETQRQHRRGYENFIGDALGVRGALRRDERNRVRSEDPYAQWWWQFAPRWSLLAGARRSALSFRSRDRYVSGGNPDDSGSVSYRETTPVAGLTFAPRDDWRVYTAYGRGFETPTFNELSYRADGAAGLAFGLAPATSRNLELGSRWRAGVSLSLQAALFRADTDDELAVARNVGGRSSFRNVGRARRQGLEAKLEAALPHDLALELAFTRLDAEFRDSFPICTAAGCTAPSVLVPAGTRIPGTARDQGFARLAWQPGHWQVAAEAVAVGEITVNDNGSEQAPGNALLHLEASRRFRAGDGELRVFARLDNALDRSYVGSVIVNEGNARYYEPGPGRTLLVGVQWRSRP